MDTPVKRPVASSSSSNTTPTLKFEDSPVFTYINSLSPIKPVKSMHPDQTFNTLNFSSPPSLFASPQISSHQEYRFFLKRHHFSNPSKSESVQCENEDNTSEGDLGVVKLSDSCAKHIRCLIRGNSAREDNTKLLIEHSESAIQLPKSLKYDFGSPDSDMLSCDAVSVDILPEMVGTPASPVHFVQPKERHCLFESEVHLRKICRIEQNKEPGIPDWVTLTSNAADMLKFDSSITEGQDFKTDDHGTTSFISTVLDGPEDSINDFEKIESAGPVNSFSQYEMGEKVNQSREFVELKESDQTPAILSSSLLDKLVVNDSGAEMENKGKRCIPTICKQQRSIRRRSLVFEVAGAHKNKLICDSNHRSLPSPKSHGEVASTDKQLVPIKSQNSCSSPVLPGIGLHLNALATTSNDDKQETLDSRRQLTTMATFMPSLDSLTSCQNPVNNSLIISSLERDLVPRDNEVQVTKNASQSSMFVAGEESDHDSPKRNRGKFEHDGGSVACKRCNCKRSKCLKLYCECFAAGLYCIESCLCQDCFNKPVHEDTVLETRRQIESRNPLAFAPKVIRSSDSFPEFGEEANKTPASARHKRGCNCKKSSCLKKYCECFQGGVGCSINCKCNGCRNTFGSKDGNEETELDGEESEACEKNSSDTSLLSNVVNNDEVNYSDCSIMPSSEIGRPQIQLPFTFSGRVVPGSSLPAVGSSQPCSSQKTSDYFNLPPKLESQLQMIPENETPEILQNNCSLTEVVKSSSPNGKRVSPPHRKLGSSTAWKSGRKLILKSIPTFPSLTPR